MKHRIPLLFTQVAGYLEVISYSLREAHYTKTGIIDRPKRADATEHLSTPFHLDFLLTGSNPSKMSTMGTRAFCHSIASVRPFVCMGGPRSTGRISF